MNKLFIIFFVFSLNCFSKEEAYDELHPYYLEVCAVSSAKMKHWEEYRTPPGHSVMYIKGACRDESKELPWLKMCDPQKVSLSSEEGAGISVNWKYKNVVWNAYPGKSLFYKGELSEDEELSSKKYREKINSFVDRGLFKNIKFHDWGLEDKPGNLSEQQFMVSENIGLDFAVNWGRTAYCSRVPTPAKVIKKIVESLNKVNAKYFYGKEEYHWNVLKDNCSHLIHNALADAGVLEKQKTNRFILQQLFHLSIPANESLDMIKLSVDESISLKSLKKNPRQMKLFNDYTWIPTQEGSLAITYPWHEKNKIFDRDNVMDVYEFFLVPIAGAYLPKFMRKNTRKFMEVFKLKKYTDLVSSYENFSQKYKNAIKEIDASDQKDKELKKKYSLYLKSRLDKINKFLDTQKK